MPGVLHVSSPALTLNGAGLNGITGCLAGGGLFAAYP